MKQLLVKSLALMLILVATLVNEGCKSKKVTNKDNRYGEARAHRGSFVD